MTRSDWKRLMIAAACLAAPACATPYARLDGVLADSPKPVQATAPGKVTVTRGGTTVDGTVGMHINKGDRIVTSADGVAVLTLRAGYEVIMEPGTEAVIESIFSRLGKFLVKKVTQIREALELKSDFVSAGAEGTVFRFEVTRDTVVRVWVLDGRVTVRSRVSTWTPVTFQAGQSTIIRGRLPPDRAAPLSPATTRATELRIKAIEDAIHYRGELSFRPKAFWQKPAFYVPAAVLGVGTTVFLVTKGSNKKGSLTIHLPL